MTTTYSTKHCIPKTTRLKAAFAICAGTALLAVSGAAFAQIDPNLKVGTAEKINRVAPADKGAHNPPDDKIGKCGHNPPDDKIGKAADTRMLLPAVKPSGQTNTTNVPKTDGTACPKN